MNYDLFKFRWTAIGSMMVGVGGALAGSELPPWVWAMGAMLSAGGAAIAAFFQKAEIGTSAGTPDRPGASAGTPGASEAAGA